MSSDQPAEARRGDPAGAAGGPGPAVTPLLRVEHLSKSFDATRAVQDFTYDFAPGKVYALVGENGSGKSTLIKMLSGILPPDRGSIAVAGASLGRLGPRRAMSAGIAACFQEVLVEDNLSALTNLFLWDRGWFRPRTRVAARREAALRVLRQISNEPPPLDVRVDRLSLAARQLLVIGRTLLQQDTRILLFDEATAALDQSDTDRVLDAIARRAEAGTTVVFTTHRMEELERIAHEIVVLRNGEVAGVLSPAELTRVRLLRLMSGRELSTEGFRVTSESPPAEAQGVVELHPPRAQVRPPGGDDLGAEAALRVRDVQLSPAAESVDVTLGWGEITGFAGLDGQGQETLLRIMGGVTRPPTGCAEIRSADGGWVAIKGQQHAVRLGLVYLPRDRKTQGIFPTRSVLENFALPTADARSLAGFVSWRRTRRVYDEVATRLTVKAASPGHSVSSLSGGNQQKILVARWLAAAPRILLFDDPTRGVDIGTKIDLYELLRQLAAEGKAIGMVSTELEELVTLCDRVIVVRQGDVTADLRRGDDSLPVERQLILGAMLGHGEAAA